MGFPRVGKNGGTIFAFSFAASRKFQGLEKSAGKGPSIGKMFTTEYTEHTESFKGWKSVGRKKSAESAKVSILLRQGYGGTRGLEN